MNGKLVNCVAFLMAQGMLKVVRIRPEDQKKALERYQRICRKGIEAYHVREVQNRMEPSRN